MALKAVFIHSDTALNGSDEDREILREFVDKCLAQKYNVVAMSAMDNAALQAGLTQAGIAGKVVKTVGNAPEGKESFAEALAGLNQMRVIARAGVVAPQECVAITDTRKLGYAAAKAQMRSLCIEGGLSHSRRALDFALTLG